MGGVTIHSEHPFLPADGDRDPLRRLRGRLPAPVTVWATGSGADRAGLTVSSMLVADGDPAHLLALVDEDSDLWDSLATARTVAVSVLTWEHRGLADAFAGIAPAPGGIFRLGTWQDTDWGPVLADASGWVGARIVDGQPGHVGWALLLDAVVEHVRLEEQAQPPIAHVRGRYRRLDDPDRKA